MKRLVTRFFFALDMDSAINVTVSACPHCTALKALPCSMEPQSTSPPPNVMGQTFAADVMRQFRQCVLVLRDTVSCYTKTINIADDKRDTLRTALLTLCSELGCLGDAGITIRVDGAPGFTILANDTNFQKHGIKLEIGNVKNRNKNPVAEKAVQELGLELLHLIPEGGPISEINLALSTVNMNASRIPALIPPAPLSGVDPTDSVHPPLELITPAELPSSVPSCEHPHPVDHPALTRDNLWI